MYRIKRKLKQNGTKNDIRKRLECVTPRLKRWYAALKSSYEPCFEALIRYESLPLRILSRKFSFLQIAFIQKKAVILFLFPTERKHFSKVFKLCKLIAIVTDKHQFAHAVYHLSAILLATEVNATHIYSSKS